MNRAYLPLDSKTGIVRIPFPIPAFLSTSLLGDMRVAANRTSFLQQCGYNPRHVVQLQQVHSRVVHLASEVRDSHAELTAEDRREGDGLIAEKGGVPVAVGIGDCVPILLFDHASGAYGILHSGWRGTGILSDALGKMAEAFGTIARDVSVHMGPCISSASYQVNDERAAEFARWGADAVVHHDDRPYLDLRTANRGIALDLGVGNISYSDHCTVLDHRLGSYRREGASYTGMLVVIGETRERLQG